LGSIGDHIEDYVDYIGDSMATSVLYTSISDCIGDSVDLDEPKVPVGSSRSTESSIQISRV
jgi:hypothetical protein